TAKALLALIAPSVTTYSPKGVALSHENVLENVHFLNYWMPYKEGAVYLHAAPMFHIIDFPLLFAAPAFGTYQVTIPKFSAQSFCEAVQREGVTHTVLVPTMIDLLTQFPELQKYDLTSLERMAYGGSPMAPELMRSYWKNPEETTLAFRDGFFRTGDVGRQDADGYFYILDRLKDMIVTGGENVYSGEVEAILYEHPAVREAAVFGIPDPRWGELVMACVVLKPGKALSADELIAFCRKSLANYKIPRRIEFSETELPKSGSGKILKKILREPFWAH